MQEDLLGYLLGALEPDEMLRVENWLREDAEARLELIELERVLKRLEAADDAEMEIAELIDPAPPADLVSRTLANLPPLLPIEDDANPMDFGARHGAGPQSPADTIFGGLALSSVHEDGGGESWKLRDWAASTIAAIVLMAISIPVLLEGRFAARKIDCQNNLRELGVSMTQFASRNAQSLLPPVAPDGYQAFAGIYSLRLYGAGLLDSAQRTLCPSIDRREFPQASWRPAIRQPVPSIPLSDRPALMTLHSLDEIGQELENAQDFAAAVPGVRQRMMRTIEKLRWIQLTAGGNYAYTLGVHDNGHFSSPRYEARSQFAVMSDAVAIRYSAGPTDGRNTDRFNVTSHGGRGINVLYEDGHVGFLPSESLDRIPDNPLVNHEGLQEAGVTLDDASLGPSWQAPFMDANQR